MTQLYFRYSEIYDKNLTKWLGAKWDDQSAVKGHQFVIDIQHEWNQINDKVFEAYESFGLQLADFWLAYPVTRQKGLIPFSDPLTFWMHDNQDELFSTLIHELAHIELSYLSNQTSVGKSWNYINSEFSDLSEMTKGHIFVNVLQWAVMEKVFGTEITDRLLKQEKQYEGLSEAWEIIDSQKDVINLGDPIGSILSLRRRN